MARMVGSDRLRKARKVVDKDSPLRGTVEGYLDRIIDKFEVELALVEWMWRMLPSPTDAQIPDLLVNFAKDHVPPSALEKLTDDKPSLIFLIRLFFSIVKDNKICLDGLKSSLRKTWKAYRLESSAEKKPTQHDGARALRKLGKMLGLSREELKVVEFVYCADMYSEIDDFCGWHGRTSYLNRMSVATDIPVASLKKALSGSGKLLSTGILEREKSMVHHYILHSDVSDILQGSGDADIFDKAVVRDTRPVLRLQSFPVTEEQATICCDLLASGRPCQILLRGSPGTGKTEFARSLVRAAGRHAFFLAFPNEDSAANRRLALHMAVRMLSPRKGVLVVDEADCVLNTEHFFSKQGDKGWLTEFLDHSPMPTLWISNSVEGTHEAVLRRFSYNLHFRPFTRSERLSLWRTVRRGHPLRRHLSDALIQDMAARYRVSAGGIATALQSLSSIYQGQEPCVGEIHRSLEELLERHAEVLDSRPQPKTIASGREYDLGLLHTDPSTHEIVDALCASIASREQRAGGVAGLRATRRSSEQSGLNLLFWGLPGTGKTEFAHHLASKLNLELLVRRASDLQSPWIGETERHIRQAFEEASRERSILFLDEADSFFVDRRYAHSSWESSQTNELLTWMENHSGLLICATNMLDRMDAASLRRFPWKVEFKPLAMDTKLRAYNRFFNLPERPHLASEQAERLATIPTLTLGDLRAVKERYRWIPNTDIDHEQILASLEKEVAMRVGNNQRIGFNA